MAESDDISAEDARGGRQIAADVGVEQHRRRLRPALLGAARAPAAAKTCSGNSTRW